MISPIQRNLKLENIKKLFYQNDSEEYTNLTIFSIFRSVLPETIPETDDLQNNNNTNYNDDLEYFVACYAYHSTEIGDLNFDAGETVLVTKKEGEWWTGSIGDRHGIFPSNYVQKIEMVSIMQRNIIFNIIYIYINISYYRLKAKQ